MDNLSIRVDHLSKEYRIGQSTERYKTLRDTLSEAAKAPARRVRAFIQHQPRKINSADNNIWALRDVSFYVDRGEVLGIIGRNGAGKSTLLKILTRITEPTTGSADLYGRVGSLLEVGTGFHHELTGRENIYLNGAILGMKRTEIERRFDEIVAFAEVEKFIDTPVKHYSSGMYLRLAFAVAAHLEPEILLVDEVLAVGDLAFQKKCLGKMGAVASEGRTVLFVSHNMTAVKHLCTRGLWLSEGEIRFDGSAADAVAAYERTVVTNIGTQHTHVIYDVPTHQLKSDFEVFRIELMDEDNHPKVDINTWENVKFRIHYYASRRVNFGSLVLSIATKDGLPLILLSTQPDDNVDFVIEEGFHYGDCVISRLPLTGDTYLVGAGLAIPKKEWLFWRRDLCTFTVQATDVYKSGLAINSSRSLLAVLHHWELP